MRNRELDGTAKRSLGTRFRRDWDLYLLLLPGLLWFLAFAYKPMLGLVTISLMVENIIGLDISLPRKTVNWTMQSLEEMGIEDLSLKKNNITILASKNVRGGEIRLESEKLYYFTIQILDEDTKKTLPIPSGKCSMLIDKL